jgi:hypothetical protein
MSELVDQVNRVNEKVIPKKIFIVPYRNRIQQKFFFSKYMTFLLEDQPENYEIYFSHQHDERNFNRGATRNIGFLAVKAKYPNHYKEMNFIFNDVDTLPFNKIFNYETTPGVVKHYYGYKHALGGIVVIRGADFERINGYPCYWGWGMEDNALQNRCLRAGFEIDRSDFHPIGSPEMLQLFDGVARIISKRDPLRMKHDNGQDGLSTIRNLVYKIDTFSTNSNDNIYVVENPCLFYINISQFSTLYSFERDQYYQYDLRESSKKIIHLDESRRVYQSAIGTEEWKNIPTKVGQPALQSQIPYQGQQQGRNVHPYSPNYARVHQISPRATKSANVGMGGVRRR